MLYLLQQVEDGFTQRAWNHSCGNLSAAGCKRFDPCVGTCLIRQAMQLQCSLTG